MIIKRLTITKMILITRISLGQVRVSRRSCYAAGAAPVYPIFGNPTYAEPISAGLPSKPSE